MSSSTNDSPTPLQTRSPDERARAIRRMFSAIAPRYDLLNHLLSLNVDRSWRRRAVESLEWQARPAGMYLDACAGTFDLSIALAREPGFSGRVVGADFAVPMLRTGRSKLDDQPIAAVGADTLFLPFATGTFEAAMVGFGIRNLADIDAGLRELWRALRPGGRLVVLDFATPPRQPLKALYLFYFTRLLPLIGRLISKHSYAYSYLPESVLAFDQPGELEARLISAGFGEVGYRPLTGGIACIWWGRRPPGRTGQVGRAAGWSGRGRD